MNERIRELAELAGLAEAADVRVGYIYPAGMEKFAELIVRECAGLVQGVPTDTMGYHTADQEIKEHFGVEE